MIHDHPLRLVLAASVAGTIALGCYSMTPQDRSTDAVADAETLGAYCELALVDDATLAAMGDAGAHVRRARSLMRAVHADVSAVLRRNGGTDAGVSDAGIGCP